MVELAKTVAGTVRRGGTGVGGFVGTGRGGLVVGNAVG